MNLFKKKEKFLLLDVSPKKISGILISLDDQKRIKKIKSWANLERRSSAGRQPMIPGVNKVIAACDPELAFKIFVPLLMAREETSEPVGRVELENAIAQAISKIFNHYRREASLVLNADELDTILADSNVSEFEVDGHRVINPLGFKPEEMRAVIEMTFTSRKTFERVKSVKKNTDIFFTEKGQAQASAAGRAESKRVDFLKIGNDKSYFYPGERSGTFYRRYEINWSIGDIVAEISQAWSLDEEAARNIYDYYVRESASRHMDKHLAKILSKPVKTLSGHVKKLKTGKKIHITGNVPASLIGRDRFREINFDDFSAKSGFAFDESDFGSKTEAFRQLASFFEFYYDNSDNEINGWLKRRLSWLGSAV